MKDGTYQHGAWRLKEALHNVKCCDFISVAVSLRQGIDPVLSKPKDNSPSWQNQSPDKLVFLLLSLLMPEKEKMQRIKYQLDPQFLYTPHQKNLSLSRGRNVIQKYTCTNQIKIKTQRSRFSSMKDPIQLWVITQSELQFPHLQKQLEQQPHPCNS